MTPGPYSTLAPRREALGLRGSGRGSHLSTQGHTAGKWQSQADPTATEIPPEALLLEDFHDGVAAGIVKELHPHFDWLGPVVPSLSFPGGLSKAVWGGSTLFTVF